MALEFGTTEIETQFILGIRSQTTMDKLVDAMAPMLGEVMGYVEQSGQEPAGMPLTIYHSMDGDEVDFECAMAVASAVEGEGRIQTNELPAGRVATVTHVGPYQSLPNTWGALSQWMEAQGLQPAGAPWEVYVTDPVTEPDESKWRTDIFFPVQ